MSLGSLSLAQTPKTVDRIVAEVNDDVITLYELNLVMAPYIERIKAMNRPLGEERRMLSDARERLLKQMIDQKLTDQEVERLEISVSDETVDRTIEGLKRDSQVNDAQLRRQLEQEGITYEEYRKQVRDQILRGRLVNREVKSKIVVTDEDIEACFIENKEEYCGDVKYHIRHIILAVPPFSSDEEKQAVLDRMDAILSLLDNGEPFIEVAKSYSESPLKEEGGDLGKFELKDLSPPIRRALEGLKPGEYSPIVDTDQGFQIFYLEAIEEGDAEALENARAEIENRLYNEIVNEKFSEWLTELRERSHIKVIE
jgi:peptidyl-prolyl cis-trans isomerase SurA